MEKSSGVLVALFFAILLSCARHAEADVYGSGWYGEVQAAYGHEDNITRTYESDTFSDEIASLSVGGGFSTKLKDNAQLILSGYLLYNRYREWDALDNFGVSLGLDYTYQPEQSYSGIWYNISLNATNLHYSESRAREGLLLNTELSANKRLSLLLTGHLGYRYRDMVFVNKTSAEEKADAAFDTDSHELFLGLDFFVRRGVYVFGEYAYREGDIRSTVVGSSGGDGYDAETLDPIFDPPCTRRCTASYAYRQRGSTQVGSLGITFPLGAVGFDLTASYYDAAGDNGEDYQDWLIKLGVLWNF